MHNDDGLGMFLWTLFIVVVLVVCGALLTRDQVYTGTDIEFTTNATFLISSGKVTIEAASNNFFFFHKDEGDIVSGVPAQPPLGWESKTYFVAGPQEINGGKWIVSEGVAAVHITSDHAITVRVIQPAIAIWILLSLVAFMIWGLGIIITDD